MKKDELYLENIDEFVNDENKVVTYKWLSRTLQVQCNTAKQMLYKFMQEEREKKKSITVTYFVSGITKPDGNGEQVLKCCVVPEEKLETCKKSLADLTSCHVYSVQKTQLKDSNALYMTDAEKTRENVFESNKYSSIRYDRAVLHSQEDMDLLSINTAVTEPEKKSSTAVSAVNTTKTAGKKQPQSAIANMFAKADTTKKTAKETDTTKKTAKETDTKAKPKESAKEPEPKASAKGGKGKQAGKMSNFFSKQTEKKEAAPAKQEPKEEKKKSPEKKPSPASKSKKQARQQDSDDDEDQVKSKRRRIKPDLFDSSEEEDMEEDDEPIPPTPPKKQPSPEPETKTREDSPEVEVTKEETAKTASPKKESHLEKGGNSGTKRRKRVRKQVKKTYMDEKGFMVTEKVWESDSTDASEAEESVKKAIKETTTQQAKGKKSPQKKPSPGKKGSGKQTSLMSFFKKS